MRKTVSLNAAVLLGACTSVANSKDLPASSTEIDFDDVAARSNNSDDSSSSEASADYLAVVEAESTTQLIAWLEEALQDNGYTLVKTDRSNGAVIALESQLSARPPILVTLSPVIPIAPFIIEQTQ